MRSRLVLFRFLAAAAIMLAVGLPVAPPAALAQAPPAAQAKAVDAQPGGEGGPPISIEAVLVSPEKPGADTLCKLSVRLKNRTPKMVSGFGFQVKVNDLPLPIYEKQRYLDAIAPGETLEIPLYNFWSTETGRPELKNGGVEVEVLLVEARFVDYTVEDDVPTWTLLDEVKGLPARATAKSPFKAGPAQS